MPREIVVDWTTSSGSGKNSVLMFDLAASVASQRLALNVFLSAVDGSLDNSVSWSIRQTGRELDDATGTLTGAWSTGLVYTGVGNNATESVADATQLLYQWITGVIVNGRFVRGRTFIPGLTNTILSNGNVLAANVTAFTALGTTFVTDPANFGIWHRPSSAGSGSFHNASACSVWSELAVLRRRRG